jgi:shikimate dehydrogenase
MQHFAVFGSPISHSLSPRIHQHFSKQTGIALDYVAIEAGPEQFADRLNTFARAGGNGANITLPLKELAVSVCSQLSSRAQRARAVNVLKRVGSEWHGDNTDGIGLVEDLTERHHYDLRGRRTLLLGAGGAARGIAPALLDAGIGELFIVNRTPEKADILADLLGEPGRVHTRYWNDLNNLGVFDFIVHTTSLGRAHNSMELPFGLLTTRSLCADASYGEAAIAFLAWAKAGGCTERVDGLGMLVEQAAESFSRWHTMRPETDAIYAELRAEQARLYTGD